MYVDFTLDQAKLYLLMLMAKVSKEVGNGFEIVSYYNVDEDVKWVIYKAQSSEYIRSSTDFVESEYFNVTNNIITLDHPEIEHALNCLSKRNYEMYVQISNISLYAYMAAVAIKKNMFIELMPILDKMSNFLRIPPKDTSLDSIRHYTAALRR